MTMLASTSTLAHVEQNQESRITRSRDLFTGARKLDSMDSAAHNLARTYSCEHA